MMTGGTVTMQFHGDERTTWYCVWCQEDITHHHKPRKPTYDELVELMRQLEPQIAKNVEPGAGTFFSTPSIPRRVLADLRNLLERVEIGR